LCVWAAADIEKKFFKGVICNMYIKNNKSSLSFYLSEAEADAEEKRATRWPDANSKKANSTCRVVRL
jgi:hypothetical protein